ncbi:GTPase-activator protein for Ras-like GTPase [Popillia japonica]|uniref:GTPase-activator protein for Ras-like GTPase n=1 Tax=Popillia japonica TaxID=7064 RepID=A0AAW1JZJ6_POPJA
MDELTSKIKDASELIAKLKEERLLVNEERKIIQHLNEKIHDYIKRLMQTAWINSYQKINLNDLVLTRADFTSEQCCRKTKFLNKAVFIAAKEVLDYRAVIHYGDFLRLLRNQPEQLAYWLATGERLCIDSPTFVEILYSVVTGLYGSILLQDDTNLMLALLKQLAYLQLVSSDNPRRLLRHGTCAFSKMYYLFHENLYSARLFLLSTLQNPIIKLIANVDVYLDIDPDKILVRFSPDDILEKFGQAGTEEYNTKIAEYHLYITNTLVDVTNAFISSIEENLLCFPSTVAWLIWQIGEMMAKSFGENSKEVNAIATDLIFTLFICPAIVNPETYGICDAPVSDLARHNLMQIAQILQILALYRYEIPEKKCIDFTLFNLSPVTNMVSFLLQKNNLNDKPFSEKIPSINKAFVLFTEQDLYNLISFLQRVHSDINLHLNSNSIANYGDRMNINNLSSIDHLIALLISLSDSQEHSSHSRVKSVPSSPNGVSKKNLLNKVAKSQLPRSTSYTTYNNEILHPTVLIIPLNQEEAIPVGLLSEQKVINMQLDKDELCNSVKQSVLSNGDINTGNTSDNLEAISEAASNHDNLEAISEAASNHSVDSSIEMERGSER